MAIEEASSSMSNVEDIGSTKKQLFDNVRIGNWEKVEEIYRERPAAHKAKITSSGHTALHLAVSNAKSKEEAERVVEQLVGHIKTSGSTEALEIQDERGYTALHFAAAIGSESMCKCIAGVDSSLVGVRNNEGETPLFWAVLYGQQEAFRCLFYIICPKEAKDSDPSKEALSYCRETDLGQTILHRAIFGEDFDLALKIIDLYGEVIVHQVDMHGTSPLDTLATKPSCFKSGCKLRGWDKIVYNLTRVDEADGCQNGEKPDVENGRGHPDTGNRSTIADQGYRFFSKQYAFFLGFLRSVVMAIVVILGYAGLTWTNKMIKQEKEKHHKAVKVLNKLLKTLQMYDNLDSQSGGNPTSDTDQIYEGRDDIKSTQTFDDIKKENEKEKEEEKKKKSLEKEHKTQTAIIVAAKNGILEVVDKILYKYPMAIHDVDQNNMKNILLLAVKNRHVEVFKLLRKMEDIPKNFIFQKVDNDRNSALHFSARVNKENPKPWPIPGAALQMQWEIKWYKFVEKSMPQHFFLRTNKEGKTPEDIFTESHENLVKLGSKWLTETSTSCSVVASLIATVAFGSSTTFPGGTNSQSGKPTLENRPSFDMFIFSSLIALCFSITALIIFLAILTSRHQEKDFEKDLPRKVLLGLTSLFISIASMLTSFCAGHFIVMVDKLKYLAFPLYVVMFLPAYLFAIAQLPLYFDLIKSNFWTPFG